MYINNVCYNHLNVLVKRKVCALTHLFSLYLKSGKAEGHRERSSLYFSTVQISSITKSPPGKSQDRGRPSEHLGLELKFSSHILLPPIVLITLQLELEAKTGFEPIIPILHLGVLRVVLTMVPESPMKTNC